MRQMGALAKSVILHARVFQKCDFAFFESYYDFGTDRRRSRWLRADAETSNAREGTLINRAASLSPGTPYGKEGKAKLFALVV